MALGKPIGHFIDHDFSTTANKKFDLDNREVLGTGMSGTVFLLENHCNNWIALKKFNTGQEDNTKSLDKATRMFKSEVNVLRMCKHPNLMSMISSYRMTDSLCITMPYMSGGNLAREIKRLTLAQTLRYFSQIADAVQYLHGKKIYHGDLKPGNVLLSEEDQAVVTDFGLSKCVPNHNVKVFILNGSRGYLAPEVDCSRRVNPFKADMYALGMTLWTMQFKINPSYCKHHLLLVEEESPTPSLKHILQSLLQEDPLLRPSASQVAEGNIP